MNPLQVYITQPMYYYIVTHDGEASMSHGYKVVLGLFGEE